MKHFTYVVATATLFAAAGFFVGSLVTGWYSDNLAKSDADISFSVAVFLVCWPAAFVAGAYLGHKIYRKRFPR